MAIKARLLTGSIWTHVGSGRAALICACVVTDCLVRALIAQVFVSLNSIGIVSEHSDCILLKPDLGLLGQEQPQSLLPPVVFLSWVVRSMLWEIGWWEIRLGMHQPRVQKSDAGVGIGIFRGLGDSWKSLKFKKWVFHKYQ